MQGPIPAAPTQAGMLVPQHLAPSSISQVLSQGMLGEGSSSPAEAQSLASSQAGDAGAAAFSDAVYNYTSVRMCLGGRAMQAENAAAGQAAEPSAAASATPLRRVADPEVLCA